MKLISSILRAPFKIIKTIFTGGKYGAYVEGKYCPKCRVNRIKIDKKCCGDCYEKYFK